MKALLFSAGACLLLGCGSAAVADPGAPMSTAETNVSAEQQHLQAVSPQLRSDGTSSGDLPLEFKNSSTPRAHNLLNLSF